MRIAINKKYLISSLFFVLCITLVGLSFFRSNDFRADETKAVGFGVSPPILKVNDMKPGEVYRETIAVLRSSANSRQRVNIDVLAPDIQSWITIEPSWSCIFAVGEFDLPIKLTIKVPQDAAPGKYDGNIYLSLQRDQETEGVGIRTAARVSIDMNVVSETKEEVTKISVSEDGEPQNANLTINDSDLYKRLRGRIVLQVESAGEAWYIHPEVEMMYFLGRPDDAFEVMRELGLGITDANLALIEESAPVEALAYIPGTGGFPVNPDLEPGEEKIEEEERQDNFKIATLDEDFAKKQSGKILLQVESAGEAWYVNPQDNRRYYLGRPDDAFRVMRELGLGISNDNFSLLTE